MKERFSLLRKALNKTQEEIGNKLGVTRAAISRLESGDRNLTEQMIIAICREFNVNEKWLRYGQGDMFIESDLTLLDQLVHEYNLDSLDSKIIESFLMLSHENRRAIRNYVTNLANLITTDSESSKEALIEKELNSYRSELEAELKGETLSATLEPKENLG